MLRPEFDSLKDYEEFSKYYWYRDELIRICKDHGLKADGSKIELNKVVEAYFSGEMILPTKKKRTRAQKKTVSELTLNTGLIGCGFTFGNRFREFFRQQTGEENFKFNVDMVATVKAVKENGDENFTLGDLLDIYYGKKVYATYDKSALQWNKFVKDFCEDEATKIFSERLKAAAALWKIVRESDMEKKYSRELLDKYRDIINLKIQK
ncbi:MAG: SAP domain-containing protein [Lachnospiraceae bacterium]|nr:SAP domain-containing protein [Lachnospiraceae bacterium]